jgi:hypothetical protein
MTRSRDTANIIPTVDAKGDLIVGSADSTVTNLAVGAEGTVLIADPSTPTGLTWGAAGGSISVSTTAPEDPAEGDLWFNSANATTYIYYDSFWVELSEAKLGPTGLPGVVIQDGQPTDSNVLWLDTDEESLAPVPAGGTTGQILAKTSADNYDTAWINPPSGNAIINGAFDIWQRGTSLSSAGFLADRFNTIATTSTVVQSRQTFTPAELNITGFGDAQFYSRQVVTSGNTAGSRYLVLQFIEDVRTFAGQNVTLSFYAKSGSGTPKVGVEFIQQFGSGGSAPVTDIGKSAITIGTSWTRYTASVSIPSIFGKTVGSGSNLGVILWLDAGSDFASRASSIGNQSNTFDIWGIQLEAGSTATPFRRNANSIQGELAACQRYYYRSSNSTLFGFHGLGFANSTTNGRIQIRMPVTMRVAPTAVDFSTLNITDSVSNFSVSAVALVSAGLTSDIAPVDCTTSGLTQFRAYALSNNNNTAGFIGLSSEL